MQRDNVSSFIIIDSRKEKDGYRYLSRFDVRLIKGELTKGDSFTLFETRHPVVFEIQAMESIGEGLFALEVDKNIPWNGQWVGSVVDTEDSSNNKKHGYSNDT